RDRRADGRLCASPVEGAQRGTGGGRDHDHHWRHQYPGGTIMNLGLIDVAFALINGMATGMAIFLVAAGLTLIFGILKILNFAHGAFFMVGAYLSYMIIGSNPSSIWLFILAALVGGVVV